MTKVYLLLRNNKQSGPHTLEELLKLGLKPRDLIWIEGKSFGWSYPSEINALKPYVAAAAETSPTQAPDRKSENHLSSQTNSQGSMPAEQQKSGATEPAPSRKVFVSMPANINRSAEPPRQQIETPEQEPADPIEQKAEELRKRIQSYVPKIKTPPATEVPIITKYSSTVPEREEEYASWIYNQKINKAGSVTDEQKKWAAIATAALLILAVGFGISQYHKEKEVVLTASSDTPAVTKTVPEPLITEPETPSTQPIIENSIADNTADNDYSEPVRKIANTTAAAGKPLKETQKAFPVAEGHKKTPVAKNPDKQTTVKVPDPVTNTNPQEVQPLSNKQTGSVADQPKKKKTFNEKVDAFFGKFSRKKEAAPVVEAASTPSEKPSTLPGTMERKAVHRDDKPVAASPATLDLADYVEVTANKPSENWMLGVHGLKVSLHNTGNEIVKTAEVELRYYTEQNEVLDKKIVNFNNIPPGKTVTLPAPDHRLADHADFRLVTVK